MLTRRLVLQTGLGALGVGLAAHTLRDDRSVDPLAMGAVGNGVADDTAALKSALSEAFASGRPLDGGDAIFAIRGDLRFDRRHAPWIRSLRVRQLAPSDGRKSLHFVECQNIRIDRLEIDVGQSRTAGYMNDSGGLWVQGGSNHRISNVDVFGHGKNSLIAIWHTRASNYVGLRARDAIFDDRNVRDDVMQGIWFNANTDCILERPIVSNLRGNASFRGKSFPNLRTRGIALGGNVQCSIIDADVRDVDQGIDFTGSDGNIGCSVVRGRAFQCTSVGLKFANSAKNCRASGFVAQRCGAQGFIISGPGEILRHYTSDVELTDCVALDIGYNELPTTTAGFMIQAGTGAKGILLRYPSAIRMIRCRAVDSQSVKTMEYGFYNNIAQPVGAPDLNRLIDCGSSGHIVAARHGFTQVG